MSTVEAVSTESATVRLDRWSLLLGLLAIVGWAYWPILDRMAERWAEDPQFSHGYLVPLFSVYLLWSRRHLLDGQALTSSLWGLALLALAAAIGGTGSLLFMNWFEDISLLPCLAGLALVVGGPAMLRWSWPAILFLAFMCPLPFRFQTALGGSLQSVATRMSTYSLQTLGVPAVSEGNIILLDDVRVGVVEACSGLGMLVTFFALAAAIAILMRSGGWWLRVAVVLSAAPIAVVANVVRITVTGLLYNASEAELARVVFHDVAGWLMMPLAVCLIFLVIHVLTRLVVERTGPAGGTEANGRMPGLNANPFLPDGRQPARG